MARVILPGSASDTGVNVEIPDWFQFMGLNVPNFTSCFIGDWLTVPGFRMKSARTGATMTEVGSGTSVTQVASALTGQDAMEFNGKSIDTSVAASLEFSFIFIVDVTAAQLTTAATEWVLHAGSGDEVSIGKRGGNDLYINFDGANINGATLTAGRYVCLATSRDNGDGTHALKLYVNDFTTPYASGNVSDPTIPSGSTWHIGGRAAGTAQWSEPLSAYMIYDRDISEDATEWALAQTGMAQALTWATA